MKEDMHSWFQELGYEESFGPGEIPSTEAHKKRIHTYAIVSAVNQNERKGIFG